MLALVGPSGCGKTTLLELICGLQPPDAGSLQSLPAVLMPQHDLLLPWLDAGDNAALALRIAGVPRARRGARATRCSPSSASRASSRRRPASCPGGMRQRVAFLRTLLSGKPVLCLDEPFGALDAITRAEMQEWLAGALAREPRTVMLVTHDVEEAILLADRVLVLTPRPGRVRDELEVTVPRPRRRTDPGRHGAAGGRAADAGRGAPVSAAIRRVLPPLLLCGLLLGAWEAYVEAAGVEADLLPPPHAVAAALWNERGLLWRNFAVTAEEVALGLGIALAGGFALGRRDPPGRCCGAPSIRSRSAPRRFRSP